jgi:predicted RNA binding protein YcfA (HicA-like mRNA interferase family)
MTEWPSCKAKALLSALLRIGWIQQKRQSASHRTLSREG